MTSKLVYILRRKSGARVVTTDPCEAHWLREHDGFEIVDWYEVEEAT